jgi:2'-hydroxyisoflavone reductase
MDDTVDCARARAAGLKLRPIAATVRDTLAWTLTRPADPPLRAGFSGRREIELLRRWHANP